MTDRKFVLLNEIDNIIVCCQTANTGEWVKLPKIELKLVNNIDVGHKVACSNIAKGQNVIRYGVSIGSATVDIAKGSHVHLHNMKSDYIPSHTRQAKVGE
jgi:hypothetical protein